MLPRPSLLLATALAMTACGAPTAPELRAHNNRTLPADDEDDDGDSESDEGETGDERELELAKRSGRRKPVRPRGPTYAMPDEILDCATAHDEYAQLRDQMNRCRSDNDCAVVSEGICPHGHYYVDRYADPEAVLAWESAITEQCEVPKCRLGKPLGPGRCVSRKCATGRPKPKPQKPKGNARGKPMPCYDFPIDFLELDTPTQFSVRSKAVDAPRLGVGVPGRGELHLEIDWSGCPTCTVELTRLHPLDGLKAPAERRRADDLEQVDLAVSRSAYFLHFQPGPETPRRGATVTVTATMTDEDGAPLAAHQHGRVYLRRCERETRPTSIPRPATVPSSTASSSSTPPSTPE